MIYDYFLINVPLESEKSILKKLVYDLINFCFMQTLILMLFLAVISLLYTILEV